MPWGWRRAGRSEPAANKDIMRSPEIVLVDQHVDVTHRSKARIGVCQVRERGALQKQEPHARSIHRDQDVGHDPSANGAGVGVLHAASAQPIEDSGVGGQSGRADVREQERVEAVMLRGIDEFARRQRGERCRQRGVDQAMARPLGAESQRLEYAAVLTHDIDAMSRRAAACASPRSVRSAVARSTVWRSIGIVRAGG